MPDLIPNCAITLHFYTGPVRFSYQCTSSSRGWHVANDGTIYPPPRRRVIRFGISGYPTSEVSFAGFQVASADDFSGAPRWTSVTDLESFGVHAIAPKPYPSASETIAEPLVFNFGPQPTSSTPVVGLPSPRLFYRLAVVVGNDPTLHWDDPKIYDDGSI